MLLLLLLFKCKCKCSVIIFFGVVFVAVGDEFARDHCHAAEQRRVAKGLDEVVEALVELVDEAGQHLLAVEEGEVLEGLAGVALMRFAEYGREDDVFERAHKTHSVLDADCVLGAHLFVIPLRLAHLLSFNASYQMLWQALDEQEQVGLHTSKSYISYLLINSYQA